MPNYLFAYGTLQPGSAPPEIADAAAKLQSAGKGFIYGELYELDGYPGAVPNSQSQNKIRGTILELPSDPGFLSQLDDYEGYDPEDLDASEFVRVRQTVELAGGGTLECWIYRYNRQPAH
jgi:gamma-glutamylcyclotransferase (GGCT)/AIG2-like uncharacterized protein YtfP